MDNKENKFNEEFINEFLKHYDSKQGQNEEFINEFLKHYDSKQGQNGLLSSAKIKAETDAKLGSLFPDTPNSSNFWSIFSSSINILQKDLEKLDTKIDKGLEKLDTKIDKSKDSTTSEFRWLIGILFVLILAITGWMFYINK